MKNSLPDILWQKKEAFNFFMLQPNPSAHSMEYNLIQAGGLFNDSHVNQDRGVGFNLSYQGKWDSPMIDEWKLTFVRKLKAAIWRPVVNSVNRG